MHKFRKHIYIDKKLKAKGYRDLNDYIDKRSNEILNDEVWLWRTKAGIQDDFPELSNCEIIEILKDVMANIVKKGGVIYDYSNGKASHIIKIYDDLSSPLLISDIVNFLLLNPDYGSNGNGIWYE